MLYGAVSERFCRTIFLDFLMKYYIIKTIKETRFHFNEMEKNMEKEIVEKICSRFNVRKEFVNVLEKICLDNSVDNVCECITSFLKNSVSKK